jgi:hypothetical protein
MSAISAFGFFAVVGANCAKASRKTIINTLIAKPKRREAGAPSFIPARFLDGERSSMNTIPLLNICTPPPGMYSMNVCMGSDFAGAMAKSLQSPSRAFV